ncbi:MAG: tRNA pseudouridine(55) synthase TruB [Bacteroidetes bacterium]|nr:MAG: tRNA pseudouridine(55) synthase TruB [Bacteroidota bacterium]
MIFSKEEIEEGQLLLIDKPLEWTSFDVVNKIRYSIKRAYGFKKIKVGHAGTLDPLATGLLIIAVGRKTKTINDLMGLPKTYTGTFKLGETTPSYDAETEVNQNFPWDHINEELINQARESFLGEQDQIPPIFSAIKKDGKKAYESAREGTVIEMQPRKITIMDFQVWSKSPQELDFSVSCSKGTYIRSLAHDFGQAVQSGAYLTALRRTAIGNFKIEDALSLDQYLSSLNLSGF